MESWGFYVIDDEATKHTTKDLPPGQVMNLYIGEKHWLLRDMLVGFEGTCVLRQDGATLTALSGAAGPLKPLERCEVTKTKKGVAIKLSAKSSVALQFKYISLTPPAESGFDKILAKDRKHK